MEKFDITIIGAGTGGYVAAIRAAQLGARVALIEKDEVGGTCLLRGCIPTKALLATAEMLTKARETAGKFGVEVGGVKLNYGKALERKNAIVQRLVSGVHSLLKAHKVEYVHGEAKLLGGKGISVTLPQGTARAECEKIVIATGSAPMKPKMFKVDGVNSITSDEALELKEIPKSILIIGGAYVGCEFASMFRDFGAEVTIVELLPQLVPTEEKEIAQTLRAEFKRRGIKVLTGTKIVDMDVSDGKVTAKTEAGETLSAEKALVAVGRSCVSDVGLDEAGVEHDQRGAIKVNEKMETNVPGIYAVGDVLGTVMLAHVSSAQGTVAVANALGGSRTFSYNAVPGCVYTRPEIASVGMKESQAIEAGYEIATGKFRFTALGKAMVVEDTTGFVKIVVDKKTDKVLGASLIGPNVTDLVHELVLAVHAGVTVDQIATMVHAHPTLSESVHEADEAVHGQAIHMITSPVARSA